MRNSSLAVLTAALIAAAALAGPAEAAFPFEKKAKPAAPSPAPVNADALKARLAELKKQIKAAKAELKAAAQGPQKEAARAKLKALKAQKKQVKAELAALKKAKARTAPAAKKN